MSVLWFLQQVMPYAIQKNIHSENKWRGILCGVYDVRRVHRKMSCAGRHQTHSLRKDLDTIAVTDEAWIAVTKL